MAKRMSNSPLNLASLDPQKYQSSPKIFRQTMEPFKILHPKKTLVFSPQNAGSSAMENEESFQKH
jgi:hypothetical protein